MRAKVVKLTKENTTEKGSVDGDHEYIGGSS